MQRTQLTQRPIHKDRAVVAFVAFVAMRTFTTFRALRCMKTTLDAPYRGLSRSDAVAYIQSPLRVAAAVAAEEAAIAPAAAVGL